MGGDRLKVCVQCSPYCDELAGRISCSLYSTQRPPSGCRSSGTDRHLLLPKTDSRPTAGEPAEILRYRDGVKTTDSLCSVGSPPRRQRYALLGFGIPGCRADCRGPRLHWSGSRFSGYREGAIYHLPGSVLGFPDLAFGQRTRLE